MRQFALKVVRQLRAAGYEALWAGGCVRDQLLGKQPKDYDVATNAAPEQVRDLFGKRNTLFIGAAFGVVTVIGPRKVGNLEVATFRSDEGYTDGRHPDHVRFSSAQEDAQRRDFTINGLFFDPISEEVIDYVGGRQDLERGILRAIGDARLRFAEDKLRMLRAVRFATTLGFTLDPLTHAGIVRYADELSVVSEERIAAEMRRILVHANAAEGLQLLRGTGLWRVVLPEFAQLSGTTLEHDWAWMLRLLNAVNEPFPHNSGAGSVSFATSLAAVLWPLAHRLGAQAVLPPIRERWRLTNQEDKQLAWMLAHVPAIQHAERTPWPNLQPILIRAEVGQLLRLTGAVIRATLGPQASLQPLQYCAERLAWPAERLNPAPLINGHDLQRSGVAAGPELGRWLAEVRHAQLDGLLSTATEAIAWVVRQRELLSGTNHPSGDGADARPANSQSPPL